MDTMLAALANTALIFAALALADAPTIRRAIATGVVAYVAYQVRPDNALYALFVPAVVPGAGSEPAAQDQPRAA